MSMLSFTFPLDFRRAVDAGLGEVSARPLGDRDNKRNGRVGDMGRTGNTGEDYK